MDHINSILLVEDDPISAFLASRVVKEYLAKPLLVKDNAKIAFEFIEKNYLSGNDCPELILLDLHTPEMDGMEFLEELYKLDCNIETKVIILSSTSALPTENAIRKRFPIDFVIEKPLTKEKLKLALKKVFNH